MQVHFSNISETIHHDATILLIAHNLVLTKHQSHLDFLYNGIITSAISDKHKFKNQFGNSRSITISEDGKIKHIILLALGEDKDLSEQKFIELGGKITSKLSCFKTKRASVIVDYETKHFVKSQIASFIAEGSLLASYRFYKYFTKKADDEKLLLNDLDIELEDNKAASNLFNLNVKPVISGVFLARDCVTEPANKLYPASYAEIITKEFAELGVTVEVLGENEMRHLGMGALLGVGQGSTNESKLVVIEYKGASKDVAPVAFVGKGVTFDTGGISLKPSSGMADMKYDMAGSAAVVGLMKTLALRKAKVNAVGVVGLVENMPGGNAQRPSDVVTTMSGQTVEVLDTDAEGRLVLSDALWYTQDRFKPQFMVNLATLTGAIVVALGHSFAGCFSNNDDLAEKLHNAGIIVDEKLWRMPLHKDFDDMIKSDIADMANLGNVRGAAGSSTAAVFLQRFVNNVPWAHLDIAGMAWDKTGSSVTPKGATGFGVRLLNKLVRDYYEQN